MMNRVLIPLAALAAITSGCLKQEDPQPVAPGAHAHSTQHGGMVVEVGDHVAVLEVVHDEAAGTMTIYVLETSAPIDEAPSVVAEGKRFACVAQGEGVFVASDDALKAHLEGARITVKVGDKTYNSEFHAPH